VQCCTCTCTDYLTSHSSLFFAFLLLRLISTLNKTFATVAKQRELNKARATGKGGSRQLLTDEQKEKLTNIGLEWQPKNPRHLQWETRFGQLQAFKQKYGHVQVPIGWSENPQVRPNAALGCFGGRQVWFACRSIVTPLTPGLCSVLTTYSYLRKNTPSVSHPSAGKLGLQTEAGI